MLQKLTSLLSATVYPGAAYVDVRPFSFPLFARINVTASANRDEAEFAMLKEKLAGVYDELNADRFNEGREKLAVILQDLNAR
jgi:hypothetical protein